MQKDTEKNQDTLYQRRLERSKLIMELQRKGIYYQITGSTPSKAIREYQPTKKDWQELGEEIKRLQ